MKKTAPIGGHKPRQNGNYARPGQNMRRAGLAAAFLSLAALLAPWPALADFSLRPEESRRAKAPAKPEEFLEADQLAALTGRLAPPAQQVVVKVEMDPPVILKADLIESDREGKLNHFVGNLSIRRGSETITADRALWHDATNTAELSGNIRIVSPEFTVMAQRAVVNLDLNMAKIYDGQAFFPARNYYVSGAVIERLGERTLNIKDGTATTCDGPSPAWTIHADNLTVTEGGYATASGVSFNTRYAPILAMPYFMFPVKNERQSGLLMPSVANSSRDGLTLALPLFLAPDENYDFTYTPVWREKRGLAHTLEGRFHFEKGKGIWQMTYLDDRDPQAYRYHLDAKEQKTNERYWLRAQNQWHLGEWDVNLNLDLVSDPLFLAEFRSDLDGYFVSRNSFNKAFGYTVNEYLDPMRNNTLFAQKSGYDSFFRGGVEYTQDLYSKDNYDTIQKLPSLQHNLVSRPLAEALGKELQLANLPRFSMETRYDYFSRLSNSLSVTDEEGHRVYLKPSMNWSSPVAGLANFELEADLGLTMYDLNGSRPYDRSVNGARDRARHDSGEDRLTGSIKASLSTSLGRVYGGFGDAVAVHHQINPTVSFSYVGAPEDQSRLPYWDYLDRRLPRQTIRYGLLNTFVKKTPIADQDGTPGGYDYFQFLKLGIWSSYEFRDNLKWAQKPEARYYTTDYFDRGTGPIDLELEAFFNQYVSIRAVSGFDGRTGKATSHDMSLRLADKRGDSFAITYDFDSPSTALGTGQFNDYEEIRADVAIMLNEDWSAGFSTRYDVRGGKDLETNAQILYRNQCYGLGLFYSDTDNDRRVGLMIDLLGFGSVGSGNQALATPPNFFYR